VMLDALLQQQLACCCSPEEEPSEIAGDLARKSDWLEPDLLQDERGADVSVGFYSFRLGTSGRPVGVDYEATSRGLMVRRILDGPLREHNLCQPSTLHVYRQDFVVRVNNKADPEGMLNELKVKHRLKFDLVHPFQVTVHIDLRQGPLDFDLHIFEKSSTVIEITKINAGAVTVHNQHCEPRRMVMAGDLIIGVNEASGEVRTMLEELRVMARRRPSGKGYPPPPEALLQLQLLRVTSRHQTVIGRTPSDPPPPTQQEDYRELQGFLDATETSSSSPGVPVWGARRATKYGGPPMPKSWWRATLAKEWQNLKSL